MAEGENDDDRLDCSREIATENHLRAVNGEGRLQWRSVGLFERDGDGKFLIGWRERRK
uniref:Uncharacterized protein n=1 Tax=Cucumis melo TaxID=3656 RepID=A0A9I9CKF3_CUCME